MKGYDHEKSTKKSKDFFHRVCINGNCFSWNNLAESHVHRPHEDVSSKQHPPMSFHILSHTIIDNDEQR
jgi:hypothetical protein